MISSVLAFLYQRWAEAAKALGFPDRQTGCDQWSVWGCSGLPRWGGCGLAAEQGRWRGGRVFGKSWPREVKQSRLLCSFTQRQAFGRLGIFYC